MCRLNMSVWPVTILTGDGVKNGMKTLVLVITWCSVLTADKYLVTQIIGLGC